MLTWNVSSSRSSAAAVGGGDFAVGVRGRRGLAETVEMAHFFHRLPTWKQGAMHWTGV